MNLVAMIGIVKAIKTDKAITNIKLKVEKPFFENRNGLDDYYDNFDIELNNSMFKTDLKLIESGTLIGLKGRVRPQEDNTLRVIAEKIQVF